MNLDVMKSWGLALLETGLLLAAVWLVWRAVAHLRRALDEAVAPVLDAEGAGSAVPDPPDRRPGWMPYFRSLLGRVLELLGLFASAGLVFFWLQSVLRLFRATELAGYRLQEMLQAALSTVGEGLFQQLPSLIVVVVILALAQAAAQGCDAVFQAASRQTLKFNFIHPETASATRRLVMLAIWAFALVAAYPYLPGSQSDAFKGLSILLGAMLTLGSSGVVTQLMSGLVLVYSRALRVGDHVAIGQGAGAIEGVVQQVGGLATKLINARNEEITVPNAVLMGNAVRNHSRGTLPGGAWVGTGISIGYDVEWRQVHALLLDAAARTPGLLADPAPYVLQRALSDFYVEYELLARLDPAQARLRLRVVSALHGNVLDAFNEAGVQIMSPHFVMQPRQAVLAPSAAAV